MLTLIAVIVLVVLVLPAWALSMDYEETTRRRTKGAWYK